MGHANDIDAKQIHTRCLGRRHISIQATTNSELHHDCTYLLRKCWIRGGLQRCQTATDSQPVPSVYAMLQITNGLRARLSASASRPGPSRHICTLRSDHYGRPRQPFRRDVVKLYKRQGLRASDHRTDNCGTESPVETQTPCYTVLIAVLNATSAHKYALQPSVLLTRRLHSRDAISR